MHERRHLYINGNWIEPSGEGSIEVINPTNEEVIGSVPVSSDSDANAAVEAARSAFTDWSTTQVSERVEFLNRISGLIKDRSEDLAEIITAEVGTPIEYSRMAMVGTPRVVSRSYAKILDGYVWEEEVRNSLVIKEPIGVVAMITPWNFPLHQIIGKVAPAIAAGCTMVLKPSKEAPLNAFLLADILDDVGLPNGVFNLISGHGRDIGETLCSHPMVDMVSFTGSTSAGIRVSELAAPSVKRVTHWNWGERVRTLYWMTQTSNERQLRRFTHASVTLVRSARPLPGFWCQRILETRLWRLSQARSGGTLLETPWTSPADVAHWSPRGSRRVFLRTSLAESNKGPL